MASSYADKDAGVLCSSGFLCCKIKTATRFSAIYVIVSASIACLLEVLDIAAQADKGFDIQGGFKAHWRSHVWEGWLACNIVMVVCHLIMIASSILLIFAVARFYTYYEFNLTKMFLTFLVIYIVIELGTSCYKFSWYGPNTFRLAYLVFNFLFWLVRTIINITVACIIYARIDDIDYEITWGEKRDQTGYTGFRSGYTTPGHMTPRSALPRSADFEKRPFGTSEA